MPGESGIGGSHIGAALGEGGTAIVGGRANINIEDEVAFPADVGGPGLIDHLKIRYLGGDVNIAGGDNRRFRW
jgi:hypothetical protein